VDFHRDETFSDDEEVKDDGSGQKVELLELKLLKLRLKKNVKIIIIE